MAVFDHLYFIQLGFFYMLYLYNSLSGPFKLYSMSRSLFNVVGFPLQFCVRSISSVPFERFIFNFTQMSLSVRQCAEPMNWVCGLKVKVNLQGHRIYPLQFPVCSISSEPFERFSLNFTQMFSFLARRCAEHMNQLWSLEVNVTVQGHGIYP